MVTHHNVVTNVLQMLAVESFLSPGGDGKPQDKQLAVLPFFHIYVSLSWPAAVSQLP